MDIINLAFILSHEKISYRYKEENNEFCMGNIATKVGGVAEIIKEEENGFIVEPKKPEEIYKKILLKIKN